MPNVPKTPTRPIRIPDPEWSDFGETAVPDRSAVVREFIRWYLRRPGAKLPARPTAEQLATLEADRYGVDLER